LGRDFRAAPQSAVVAQLVERVLGKDEVTGSSPVNGSSFLAVGWWNARPALFSALHRADLL
jgi:hypothetical protein